jgi:hypothetical protein
MHSKMRPGQDYVPSINISAVLVTWLRPLGVLLQVLGLPTTPSLEHFAKLIE